MEIQPKLLTKKFNLDYLQARNNRGGTETSIPPMFFVWLRLNATAPSITPAL